MSTTDRHDVANQQLVNVIMFNDVNFVTGAVVSLEYYSARTCTVGSTEKPQLVLRSW